MDSTKYIGMDVHKETIAIAVLNSAGKLVIESILETKAMTILQFVQGLRGTLQVTFEEGTWAAWLYDLLKPYVRSLRLACGPRRYGDRYDCSVGIGCPRAPAWFRGGQELRGLESFRHFGPHRSGEYRGARPAARSQSLRSCLDDSYDTAPAGADSDILSANILDTAFDCTVSGATSRQISSTLPTWSYTHARTYAGLVVQQTRPSSQAVKLRCRE